MIEQQIRELLIKQIELLAEKSKDCELPEIRENIRLLVWLCTVDDNRPPLLVDRILD